jgi:hypothetical protein
LSEVGNRTQPIRVRNLVAKFNGLGVDGQVNKPSTHGLSGAAQPQPNRLRGNCSGGRGRRIEIFPDVFPHTTVWFPVTKPLGLPDYFPALVSALRHGSIREHLDWAGFAESEAKE